MESSSCREKQPGEWVSASRFLARYGEIAGANLETLTMCFGFQCGTIGPGSIPKRFKRELATLLLERVRGIPDHPKAAEVLCEVCYAPEGSPEVPPAFEEAARMIGERWTNSPDISHFLGSLSFHRQRPWAGRYEPVVRSIATRNTNPYVRYHAKFTLAQLIAERGEARQEPGGGSRQDRQVRPTRSRT